MLDKAMEIHPGLSFDSYDRLFPNQDMMPAGGFGNLIALPLQHEVRQFGNSLFVDDRLQPYEDQWAFLSRVNTMSASDVNKTLERLMPQIPVTLDKPFDPIPACPPWEQSLRVEHNKIAGCPRKVTVTLANHLYLKIEDIPAQLAAQLRRVASFSNPVFFKTQAMRFSTHGIPRYITCARIEQNYLSLPRGCLEDVLALLKEQNITVNKRGSE